jgi:serine phosphatase RsbU (regulator of sigma subunit)
MDSVKRIWTKLSRFGLHDHEGILGFREVILLNKVLVITPVLVILLLPIEIIINGFEVVPLELIFLGILLVPLIMHKYRLFWLARLYCLIVSNLFIVVAGSLVGKGINNHIAMIPIMLFGIILFKKTRDKIIVFLLSLLFYVLLLYLHEVVVPVYTVPEENRKSFSIIFYILSLLLTFILGFYFLNINKEYEELINQQRDHLAEKNKEITDSINYAKRIQQAKLPDVTSITQFLPQSFILFKPKDIVSGDFYFFRKKANTCYIAAADCTGHGVPGALMSMVASEQLDDALRQSDKVSEILSLANKGIKSSLRQTESADSTRDGMDIVLCCIDYTKRLVKYSAANRPLWIIRHGQKQVEEIKATKKAIGGLTDDHQQFEEHELQFQSGDTIYLFTDGYADQFSGKEGKKLMTKKFKEILLSQSASDMPAQQRWLDQFIEDWKGGAEQIDDILVIGIRF